MNEVRLVITAIVLVLAWTNLALTDADAATQPTPIVVENLKASIGAAPEYWIPIVLRPDSSWPPAVLSRTVSIGFHIVVGTTVH
jgi:hypothetical protein